MHLASYSWPVQMQGALTRSLCCLAQLPSNYATPAAGFAFSRVFRCSRTSAGFPGLSEAVQLTATSAQPTYSNVSAQQLLSLPAWHRAQLAVQDQTEESSTVATQQLLVLQTGLEVQRSTRGADTPHNSGTTTSLPPQPVPQPRKRSKKRVGPLKSREFAAKPGRAPKPRLYEDDAHPLTSKHIPSYAWRILARLRSAGHEAYVVGGALRDAVLGNPAKDVDILTSAEPHQVKSLFGRCLIVGRRFPVALVTINGTTVEVSSFSTTSPTPQDASLLLHGLNNAAKDARKASGKRHSARHAPDVLPTIDGGLRADRAALWSGARQQNAAARDFTVNGLLYDPFSRVLYDYVNGIADCKRRLLRTISPPDASFEEDPARVMRALRLAARAGLNFETKTMAALRRAAPRLLDLPSGRLMLEVSVMLGYGAAAPSLALMWRHRVLDIVLPHHAAYLKRRRVPREVQGLLPDDALFDVLTQLDAQARPGQPMDPAVCFAALAAPLIEDAVATSMDRYTGEQSSLQQQQQQLDPCDDSEGMEPPVATRLDFLGGLAAEKTAWEHATKQVVKDLLAGGSALKGRNRKAAVTNDRAGPVFARATGETALRWLIAERCSNGPDEMPRRQHLDPNSYRRWEIDPQGSANEKQPPKRHSKRSRSDGDDVSAGRKLLRRVLHGASWAS